MAILRNDYKNIKLSVGLKKNVISSIIISRTPEKRTDGESPGNGKRYQKKFLFARTARFFGIGNLNRCASRLRQKGLSFGNFNFVK